MRVYHSICVGNKGDGDKAPSDWRPAKQENESNGNFQQLLDRAKAELEKEDGARAKADEAGMDTGATQRDDKAERDGANATTQKMEGEDASAAPPTNTRRRWTTASSSLSAASEELLDDLR